MRKDIVHTGASRLRYEIREIVQTAEILKKLGVTITLENIGDPIEKGENVADWIRDIIVSLVMDNKSYGYSASAGFGETREFLANQVNQRGGAQITNDDILFFNGLGDAVSTLIALLHREARILGPSPSYPIFSSLEASHSGYAHLTYKLNPAKNWQPDIEEIRYKAKYNDSIAGILIINPDNPTGAVYPRSTLKEIIEIAREHKLFVLFDETYINIVYPGIKTAMLSEVIGEVPGIALRSISKDFPWPGARCGWMEVFNQEHDEVFRHYITSLLDAKRLEVCSTTLPQMSIPRVLSDSRYPDHLKHRAAMFSDRSDEAVEILSGVPGIIVVKPSAAFYLTIVFDVPLPADGPLPAMANQSAAEKIKEIVTGVTPDKRFAYWLLGATGICTVPLSGFCSNLLGFRTTLLENNNETRRRTYRNLADAITRYLSHAEALQ